MRLGERRGQDQAGAGFDYLRFMVLLTRSSRSDMGEQRSYICSRRRWPRGSSIPSMSESGPVTHLYRYAASPGLRRQEPVSGPARDVLSLATSGGVTEAGPVAHPPWWGQHRGTRGPCRHVLAARIVLGRPGGAR